MTFPYIQAFPGALTTGIQAPGWTNKTGSNFIVQSGGLGEASPANGQTNFYTGGGTLTDQEITFTTTSYYTNTNNQNCITAHLRASSIAGTDGVLVFFQPCNNTIVLLDAGSGFAQIGCTMQVTAPSNGVAYTFGASVIGRQVGFTFQGFTYQPQDWIIPSGYTAGYTGIRYSAGGTWATNSTITSVVIDNTPSAVIPERLTEVSVKPVIPAGQTYNGTTDTGVVPNTWFYDTVTSQFMCSNSLAVSSSTKTANVFHTSPNLQTFTYLSGSLMTVQGSDIVIELCGLLRVPNTAAYGANANNILATGLHYPATGPFLPNGVSTWIASTLLGVASATPTNNVVPAGSSGQGDFIGQFDASCVVNPVTGNIECWYGGYPTSSGNIFGRTIMMAYTSDLVTWTRSGVTQLVGSTNGGDYYDTGAPSVVYATGPDGSANARWLSYDGASADGYRLDFLAWAKQISPGVWGPFTKLGPFNYQRVATTYESVTVFGGYLVGVYDRGDGNGPQFYFNYTGQASKVTGIVTNAAIGLGYFPPYQLINAHYASMFIV